MPYVQTASGLRLWVPPDSSSDSSDSESEPDSRSGADNPSLGQRNVNFLQPRLSDTDSDLHEVS